MDRPLPENTVFVFHLGGVGGPGQSLLPLAEMLTETGRIECFVPEPGWVADRFGRLGPVTVAGYGALTYARHPRELAVLVRDFVAEVRRFRAAFRERRPDLVVAVTTTVPAALLAAHLEAIPTLLYAAEIYDQRWKDSALLHMWGEMLARASHALATGVVCCSHAVARQFPAPESDLLTVAYPPITDEVAGGDRTRGRRRHGLEGADPCLAVVGAISRGRGQDVAVRALSLVRQRHPAARLVLVGAPHPRPVDIAYAAELRELATTLEVADAVVYTGALDDMADLFAAADVVLNPARFEEPFGRVAPEALLAGVPVVSARVGALDEVIRDGLTGLLVPPDDPEALARAALRLHEDAELRSRLVAAGQADVRARFSREANDAVCLRILEAIAEQADQNAPRPLTTA